MNHGTRYGWFTLGCRCEKCRKGRLESDRRRRRSRYERAAIDPSIVPHGTAYALKSYGCHCDACVEANRETDRRLRGSQARRVFTEDEIAKAMEVYATQGRCQAAEVVGVSPSTVYMWAKARGVQGYRPPIRHGVQRYSQFGCRCDVCKDAVRAYKRVMRARGVPEGTPHGRYTTYGNYGCRCEPCKQAHHVQMAKVWQRRKGSR